MRAMGREHHASIKITGPGAPGLFDDLDPSRVARASMSLSPEWHKIEPLVNWTVVPSPPIGWARARALGPGLSAEQAVPELWNDITTSAGLISPTPSRRGGCD